jgi:hypothetical protein
MSPPTLARPKRVGGEHAGGPQRRDRGDARGGGVRASAGAKTRADAASEIVEAFLLAVVAIATAWGGYQAARWDGRQAELYGRSSTIRKEADQALTLGGQ